jgi:hypothetical protein
MFGKRGYQSVNAESSAVNIPTVAIIIGGVVLAFVIGLIALGFAITAYNDSRAPTPEAYNIYYVGNSHSSGGGEMRERVDIRSEIGHNIHLSLPNNASVQIRFNERFVSSDGLSKTELVARECDLKYVNGWSIKNAYGGSGFLYDYCISGAATIGNSRLSSFNQTVVGKEKYSSFESVYTLLDVMGTNDFSPRDLVWFGGNYNDIFFIGYIGAGFPNNLPPGTTVPHIIGNSTANHVELINTLYERGARRIVVELWESILNIKFPIWYNVEKGFPGSTAVIQGALTVMVGSIKNTLKAKLVTDWPELDLHFVDISGLIVEVLSNLNKYGINPDLNLTMIQQLETNGRLTRNLYHWDDDHMSQHTMQHIAKFQCNILKRPLLDNAIGGLEL